MSVVVDGVAKTYRARRSAPVRALKGVELEVSDGELVVVVGPSGSGKSTLLRCIAGLEEVDAGRIEIAGRDVTGLSPGDRDIAMVFQEYALFPHLDVAENIAFGLRARKVPDRETTATVARAAELLAIGEVLERRPAELSGGERQRVALARAIVREPSAFLMDEPLSDLDAGLRAHMRAEIRALHRKLGTTTVYVTHDQVEAMTMGDRVAVLRDGHVEQVAEPSALYDEPATSFVARFIGNPPMNVFPASLIAGDDHSVAGIRPEHLVITSSDDGRVRGKVVLVEAIGYEAVVHVAVGDETLLTRIVRAEAPRVGTDVGLSFFDHHVHRFDREGRAAI